VARSVTLADLGLGGMEPGGVVDEGRRVFREENLDVFDAIVSGRELTNTEKEDFRLRFIDSSRRQETFIGGRRDLFEKEIQGFPPETQSALRELFGGFGRAMQLLAADITRVERMTYDELVKEMGY
jgi:hypothetical protein